MSSEEAGTEDSVDSLSEVTSSDKEYTSNLQVPTKKSPDDEIDLNVWNEIESDSHGEFLENHGIIEQVMLKSDDGIINPIDCYRHFITDEVINLMVRETNRYAEQQYKPSKQSKKNFNGNQLLIKC